MDENGARLVIGRGLHIVNVNIFDPVVTAEALRWTTGVRGDPVDETEAELHDLTPFVCETAALGARVLAATSDTVGVAALSTTVTALAERAESATTGLVETAQRASTRAIEASTKATAEAQTATSKVVEAALMRFEAESARTLDARVESVTEQLDRLLAEDGGPIAMSIKQVVNRAMAEAQESWHRSLTDTMTRVSGALDATDPGTPFGQLTHQLKDDRQRQNAELYSRIDRLQNLVVEAVNAATTSAAVAFVQAASPAG